MNIKKRIASQSSIIFAMRLLGAGMIVFVQAAIARLWGGGILGEYLLVMAIINLVAMVMPLGFQTVGTYFAAEYQANGQGKLLVRFLMRAYAHVLFVALSIGFVGFVFVTQFDAMGSAGWLSWVSESFVYSIAHYWMQGILLAAAIAIVFVNGAVLVGLKRPYSGFFADGFFRPMLVVAAFVVSAVIGDKSNHLSMLLWIFALTYGVVALLHFFVVIASVTKMPTDKSAGRKESGRWWRFAMPWVLIDLATLYFFDIDLIVLSGMMDKETLAIFGVCTRMFSLMAFGITAVYAVSLPDMFEAAAKSDRSDFYRKVGDANLVAVLLSMALFVGILIGGPLVLAIFGPSFLAGKVPLALLSLTLVVRSIFGPAALVLSIHDRPWASMPAIGAGLGILMVGNILFVPVLGLVGAALAALAAFSIWAALMWWIALLNTQIDVSIFPRVRYYLRSRKYRTS